MDYDEDFDDLEDIKAERVEKALIKVRTPGQLNDSVTKADENGKNAYTSFKRIQPGTVRGATVIGKFPNNSVVLKRLGNTTIRTIAKIPSNPLLAEACNNNNNVKQIAYRRMSVMPRDEANSSPTADVRDHIIQKLQEQNREMKKALIDFNREAIALKSRFNNWSNSIESMLEKFSKLPQPQGVPRTKVKITARKSTSPRITRCMPPRSESPPNIETPQKSQPSPKNVKIQVVPAPAVNKSNINVEPSKVVQQQRAKKVSQLAQSFSTEFPITSLDTLRDFDRVLHQVQYFAHVKRNISSSFKDVQVRDPKFMLEHVLKSLIHPDLIGQLTYNQVNDKSVSNRANIKHFPTFLDLFSSLVNTLSMRTFQKKVDPNSINTFIKNKLNKKKPIEPTAEKQMKMPSPAPNPIPTATIISRSPINSAPTRHESCDSPGKLVIDMSGPKNNEHKNENEMKVENHSDDDEDLFTLEDN